MKENESQNQSIINKNVRNETERQTQQIADLNERIATLNAQLEELRTKMAESESRIESLEEAKHLLKEDLALLYGLLLKAQAAGVELFDEVTGAVKAGEGEPGAVEVPERVIPEHLLKRGKEGPTQAQLDDLARFLRETDPASAILKVAGDDPGFAESLAEYLESSKELESKAGRYLMNQIRLEGMNEELREAVVNYRNLMDPKASNIPSGMSLYRNGRKNAHGGGDKEATKKPRKRFSVAEAIAGIKDIRLEPIKPEEAETRGEPLEILEGKAHYVVGLKEESYARKLVPLGYVYPKVRGEGTRTFWGKLPKEYRHELVYDDSLKEYVWIHYFVGNESIHTISEILRNRFGVSIAPSTVMRIVAWAYAGLAVAREEVRQRMIEAGSRETNPDGSPNIQGFDETSVDLCSDNKKLWDHCAQSPKYTLHWITPGRGLEDAMASGVLAAFRGYGTSDFWAVYLNDNLVYKRVFCWAHLERELEAALRRSPNQKWIPKMVAFAKESYLAYITAVDDGETSVPEEKRLELEKAYDEAAELGVKENEGKTGKTAALARRFVKHKEGVFRHLIDVRIPRTNNASEQAVRPFKVKLKMCGCFDTDRGVWGYADALTVRQTAAKLGLNPIEALLQVSLGNADYLFTGEELPGSGETMREMIALSEPVIEEAEEELKA